MKTKNKFKSGKQVLTFVFLSVFLLSSAFTFAQKANFSGTWTFNQGQSKVGEGRFRSPASKITATQDANTLNTERLSKNRNGEDQTMKEKINLDGTATENVVFQDRTRKSTAAWSADGKSLTISYSMSFDRNGEKMEIKSSEVWKLSEDGNTLTIEATSTSPNGEVKQTLVYDQAK